MITRKYYPKWTMRFLALAQQISTWSKDPSTKCGAVIVDDDRKIISTGYNGFPAGMDDTRLKDREFKVKHVIHAEMNAIFNARCDIRGMTLYINMPPCSECAKLIGAAGIKKVIWLEGDAEFIKRWKSHDAEEVLNACGIDITSIPRDAQMG